MSDYMDRSLGLGAAFVLTRPFGAAMGDLLTKSHAKGGLDFGTIGTTLALLAVLAALVAFSIRQDRRAKGPIDQRA
jgi:uncharacterized membrane-anchored protein